MRIRTKCVWAAAVALLALGVVVAAAAGGSTRPVTSHIGSPMTRAGESARPTAAKPNARVATNPTPMLSGGTSSAAPAAPTPTFPSSPTDVLYDQMDSPASVPGGVTSQDFETAFDTFDSFAADDFVVPAGQSWDISGVDVAGEYNGAGPAASFNVFFYANAAGNVPGTLVASRLANPFTNAANASITLTSPVSLSAGTYWVSVQARQDIGTAGQWFWDNRTASSNQGAAWQNPGGGFSGTCHSWTRKMTCLPTQNGPDQLFRLLGAASVPCGSGTHRVLLVAGDTSAPTALRSAILAQPGVSAVDVFAANAGTPTLAQLTAYDIVVAFSNAPFSDAATLGNNLADYVDAGGIVVQTGFSFYGPSQPYGINGRWLSGNYNPYTYTTAIVGGTPFTLGTHSTTHPLMAGVTALNTNYQNVVTPVVGATQVAAASNGNSLVAYKPVSGGHTTVGVTGYVGGAATQSGQWGRLFVNAGNWLGAGSVATPFSQSFDGLAAPALPACWSATNARGPAPMWVSSASTPSSAPNTAFVDDPATYSDKRLDSPRFLVRTASAQLSFQSNYALETTFDGGVLEISINGGPFKDILAAGGSFVTGGYNRTISSSFNSSIAGRQAWSGSSGGFTTTTVRLPAAAAGQYVVLRWRMASDVSFGSSGWRVDSIQTETRALLTVSKAGNGTGTVTSAPAAISCGATCSARISGSVTLTATPAPGTAFTGWSGGCSGTATCVVPATADRAVTAHFVLLRTLTVTKTGNGTGKVTTVPAGITCPTTCATTFLDGTAVTLKAAASKKSLFAGWTGDCSGKSTCSLTMSANHATSAKFVAKCVVPKLKGLTLKKARAKLKKAHCRAGKVTKKASTKKQQGRVLKQKPKPGKILKPNAKVNLTVGKGGL